MDKKFVVGLTGQSGSGKTTVSSLFKDSGFYVIDCDKVSRKVTEKGSFCCLELSKIFPNCFDEELALDRRKLGQIVFGDADKLKILNEIIFPYIISEVESEAEQSGCGLILFDAPTLFEAKMEGSCDCIVSVVADEKLRLDRISKRDELDKESVMKRFSSQKTQQFFCDNSDFIIENNSDRAALVTKTKAVISKIKEMADVSQYK